MEEDKKFEHTIEEVQKRDEERVAQQRADAYGYEYLNLSMAPVQYDALTLIKEKYAREARIAIIKQTESGITVAVEDPKNKATKEALEDLKKDYSVHVVITSHSGLEEAWEGYPPEVSSKRSITGYVDISTEVLEQFRDAIKSVEDVQKLLKQISQSDASSAFEIAISAALTLEATDIHIEPQEDKNILRMRFDGLLYEVAELDDRLYKLILSRIKLLAKLKLNVHNEPQEGRLSVKFEEREIELRISILPSEYNEDVAMRILDPKNLLSLKQLGLRKDLETTLKHHLKQPQGLIVVTGPTGSGKTTTLYAGITFIKNTEVKVITIEDPIEYHLGGITQTQTNVEKEYTFEKGVRAILRQDPNVVLISELRGLDSAEPALQAALAGRLVLSTLHTVDAAGAAPRLIDLGADPSTVASALTASVAQRLVRKLCEKCKKERQLTPEEFKIFNKLLNSLPDTVKHPSITPERKIYTANKPGCANCRNTGYRGREAVYEILTATKSIKKKIMNNPPEEELRDFAYAEGMTSIKQDAVLKIMEGKTDTEEVERVLGSFNMET
ncbi:MAG: GspE/PulE family protein [Candidatus Spechtbacterales bacterium]